MANTELENIAERAICDNKKCRKPNLLWQPGCNLFRCGWCGKDFQVTEALKLPRLTNKQYKKIKQKRSDIIASSKKAYVKAFENFEKV